MPLFLERNSADEFVVGNLSHGIRFSRRHDRPVRVLSPTIFPPASPKLPLQLTTLIRVHDAWQPMFDVPSPLLSGDQFDLWPDEFSIIEETSSSIVIRLHGRQRSQGYDWHALVELREGSPLIHVTVVCKLALHLVLADAQPSAMFWTSDGSAPTVILNQGPGNIYSGPDENGWGNAFPAAYLWCNGKETALFAQMSQLQWMTASRFNRAYRVECLERAGQRGLGLHARQVTRNPIPPGEHVMAEYFLYAAARGERPTRLEALDRMIDVFVECHPADSDLPVNHDGGPTTWEHFAKGMIRNLLVKDQGSNPGACWDHVTVSPPWNDGLTDPVDRLRISPDYATCSGSWASLYRRRATDLWDFSTCFNYVAPWVGIERLEPNGTWRAALDESVRSMPTFYDHEARMIVRSRNHPPFDMPWQLFTFHYEMLKVHDMTAPERFDPAIAGQVLLSIPALIKLAHNEEYVFSQWVEPYRKQGVVNQDIPSIGRVREPWQIGSYAWIMTRAYEMTGRQQYLREAKDSMERLLGGGMTFSVANEHYSTEYSDVVDFPITEIFGNGFGIAAGQRVYELTGDKKYLRYARDFLNNLLRVTFWYESALDTDARDCILRNAGLFPAYHSYAGAAPWETIEAYLPMTMMLRGDSALVPVPLLMRLFNTMRINAFWFYPPVYPDGSLTARQVVDSPADYLSIENFYMPERGGDHGGMGRCIYMGQLALWNYLLFEATAVSDDPRVMVLNLDVLAAFHEAVSAAERNFYLFNPTQEPRSFRLTLRALVPGKYELTFRDEYGQITSNTYERSDLNNGVAMTLSPMTFLRLRVEHEHASRMRSHIKAIRGAQHSICRAYCKWQELRRDRPSDTRLTAERDQYVSAMNSYRKMELRAATERGQHIAENLASTPGMR